MSSVVITSEESNNIKPLKGNVFEEKEQKKWDSMIQILAHSGKNRKIINSYV